MNSFFMNNPQLVWPIILLLAWAFGEVGTHLAKIPKITFYTLFGFIFSKHQIGPLPTLNHSGILSLVYIIAGLMLFKFGYRINLRWIWSNPRILLTSIMESSATFIVVFVLSRFFGISILVSLEFAALLMATSPLVIMNIIDDQQSSGQVTERVLHLTALNCIFAIFVFKLILGMMVFAKSGSLYLATLSSLVMLVSSIILGVGFALLLWAIMNRAKIIIQDSAIALTLVIILIVGLAQSLSISPIIATLAFGLAVRYKKIAMGQNQRDFGVLENILTIVLFVVIPLNLDWHNFAAYISLGIALFLSRLLVKTAITSLCSYCSGTSLYKGILTGIALTPTSIFSILLLDQSQSINVALNHEFLLISGLILFLELVGPWMTQYALIKAKESAPN